MEHLVSFKSDGLTLSGIVHVPADMKAGERRPAMIVLHGFGSNKNGGNSAITAKLLESLGYVTMRFDMRGCGDSEGVRGKTICLEQVADTSNALSYLATRAEIDPKRIGVIGHSFGAAVAVYTAGVDPRVAVCYLYRRMGRWRVKFRKQHESPEAWKKFSDMLAEGRAARSRSASRCRCRASTSCRSGRDLRTNLSPGSIFEFPFEVVESMYTFRANDVVGKIAPRPLLLMHPAVDTVTPTEQSIELFKRAGQPADLHLIAEIDHFMLTGENQIVIDVLRSWLARHFPAKS